MYKIKKYPKDVGKLFLKKYFNIFYQECMVYYDTIFDGKIDDKKKYLDVFKVLYIDYFCPDTFTSTRYTLKTLSDENKRILYYLSGQNRIMSALAENMVLEYDKFLNRHAGSTLKEINKSFKAEKITSRTLKNIFKDKIIPEKSIDAMHHSYNKSSVLVRTFSDISKLYDSKRRIYAYNIHKGIPYTDHSALLINISKDHKTITLKVNNQQMRLAKLRGEIMIRRASPNRNDIYEAYVLSELAFYDKDKIIASSFMNGAYFQNRLERIRARPTCDMNALVYDRIVGVEEKTILTNIKVIDISKSAALMYTIRSKMKRKASVEFYDKDRRFLLQLYCAKNTTSVPSIRAESSIINYTDNMRKRPIYDDDKNYFLAEFTNIDEQIAKSIETVIELRKEMEWRALA